MQELILIYVIFSYIYMLGLSMVRFKDTKSHYNNLGHSDLGVFIAIVIIVAFAPISFASYVIEKIVQN